MANTVTSRRPIVGILLIVAGALVLIGLLFSLVAPAMSGAWLGFLTDVALGLAFLFLALSRASDLLLRIAFIVALVGWFLLALISIIPGLGGISILALILALVGSLGSGILVFIHSTFSRPTNIWFLVAMIVTALYILAGLAGNSFGLGVVLALVWGASLVVAGFFVVRYH